MSGAEERLRCLPGVLFPYSFFFSQLCPGVMPRKDLKVMVAGTPIKPGLALGSWAAFSASGDPAIVMGDLVLTEDEVAPVLSKLEMEGIVITALHNHILHESPRVMYVHIAGMEMR